MAWQREDTEDIARQVMEEFGGEPEREPNSLTEAAALNASREAEDYPELVQRRELAGNTLQGDIAVLAGDLNEAAMLDGEEEFAPDAFDTDDVIGRIAARSRFLE